MFVHATVQVVQFQTGLLECVVILSLRMDLQWKATNTTQSGEQCVYSTEKYDNIIDLYEDVLIYWFHPSETNWFVNNLKEKQITGREPISRLEITSSKVSAEPLYFNDGTLSVDFALTGNDDGAILYGLTESVAKRLEKMRRLYIVNFCSIMNDENRDILRVCPVDIMSIFDQWCEDEREYMLHENTSIIWPSLSVIWW